MVHVAIGIILRDQQVLICRRRSGSHLSGLWEFPGGKCHPNEPPQACLARELMEELGITVQVTRALPPIDYDYPTRPVRLYPFLCALVTGQPQPLAAEELRWVPLPTLCDYPFPPANTPLLRDLAALSPANS